MPRTRTYAIVGTTLVLVALSLSAQRAATGVGSVRGADAVAFHGAWQMYRRLALFFGERALAAETAYWNAVKA